MKIRPLHDRVLLKRLDDKQESSGGIIIPDTAREKPIMGEVLAVGPGARDETGHVVPLDVKAGNRVVFGKYAGTEVKLDGEDLVILKEADVFGILEGTARVKAAA